MNKLKDLNHLISFSVSVGEKTLYERYFNYGDENYQNNVLSVTKSVTSLLVGMAIDEGRIKSVEDSIGAYINLDEFENAEQLSKITIRDVLTMRQGLSWNSRSLSQEYQSLKNALDPLQHILSREILVKPGTQFNYSDGAAHLMSIVFTKATGQSLQSYAEEKLFKPLGIESPLWLSDRNGSSYGGFDLHLTNKDMMKIGLLVMNKGVYNNERIVSESWINESTSVQTSTGNGTPHSGSYGFYWWLGEKNDHILKAAFGHGGQMIYVVDDLDLVVVAACNGKVSDDIAQNHFVKVQSIILNDVLEAFETSKENKLKVAIYSGSGADPYLQSAAEKMFESMNYEIFRINADAVNDGEFDGASILYFAGGSTGPFRRDISKEGRANIKSFVSSGHIYMGTCAGALIACRKNEWNGQDDNYGLFQLIDATGIGPIGALDMDNDGAEMAELHVKNPMAYSTGLTPKIKVLSINSPYFEFDHPSVQSIAKYTINNESAYVIAPLGEGFVFLTGPHPEIEEDNDFDGFSYFDRFTDPETDWLLIKRVLNQLLSDLELETVNRIPEVVIGKQTWTAVNYPYQGNGIPTSKGIAYNNVIDNVNPYGLLLTYEEAILACPIGWRIPTKDDWEILFAELGGVEIAGTKLKSSAYWNEDNEFSSGFNALPSGGASQDLRFDGLGWAAHFWSSTQSNGLMVVPTLTKGSAAVDMIEIPANMYASVRYVKNK